MEPFNWRWMQRPRAFFPPERTTGKTILVSAREFCHHIEACYRDEFQTFLVANEFVIPTGAQRSRRDLQFAQPATDRSRDLAKDCVLG